MDVEGNRMRRRWLPRWVVRVAVVLAVAVGVQFVPVPVWAEQSGQADAATSTDLLGFFAQYGPLGVITALLIWFARGAHQRERDRADRLEEDVKRLNSILLDRVIPALSSATQAAEQSAEILRAFQRDRDRADLLDERRTAKGGNL